MPDVTAAWSGYLVTALGFSSLALLALSKQFPNLTGTVFFIALGSLAVWGWNGVFDGPAVVQIAGILAFAAAFLVFLALNGSTLRKLSVGAVLVVTPIVSCSDHVAAVWIRTAALPVESFALFTMSLSVTALAVLSLFSARRDAFWATKHLWIAAIILSSVTLALSIPAVWSSTTVASLLSAQGWIYAGAVPFLAVAAKRNPQWMVHIHLSRPLAYGVAGIVAAGLLLTVTKIAITAMPASPVLNAEWVIFLLLFACLVAAAAALASNTVRTGIRLFILRHFFAYRYDYRSEWNKFLSAMSANEQSLYVRAIHAAARVVDSPGGALWLCNDAHEAFELVESLHLPGVPQAIPFSAFPESASEDILELVPSGKGGPHQRKPPAWIAGCDGAWLAVVCRHRDQPLALLVLHKARVVQTLGWEERHLLQTISRQIAGYLAEEVAQRQLDDHLRIMAFNRNVAFTVHDIKSMTHQLTLLAENIPKHKQNPAFLDDMVQTVRHLAGKMDGLVRRLKQGDMADSGKPVDVVLAPLLRESLATWRDVGAQITLQTDSPDLVAVVDPHALQQAIAHLILNAMDAKAEGQEVKIHVSVHNHKHGIAIEIADNGSGMCRDVIQDRLFRPLQSSKDGGLGLGAFQARELVSQMGGKLQVVSIPGSGTVMRMILPSVQAEDVTHVEKDGAQYGTT